MYAYTDVIINELCGNLTHHDRCRDFALMCGKTDREVSAPENISYRHVWKSDLLLDLITFYIWSEVKVDMVVM